MYKLVQAKIWKTIGKIDDILNLVLDSFILFSNQHGVGSPQAEAMADTFVTLSNVAVRGKVISRLRKVLQKTSFKPTRVLTDHPTWTEIAVLLRFILMLSFNNRGPVKSYVPEIFHIISLVVGVGPTIVRASVHGLVANIVQSLCTSMPLNEGNIKKLQLLLTELSDSKSRLLFGLLKPHANAFTITPETLNDISEPIHLSSLETIVNHLLEVLQYGAPSIGTAILSITVKGENYTNAKGRCCKRMASTLDELGSKHSLPIQSCDTTPCFCCPGLPWSRGNRRWFALSDLGGTAGCACYL